MTVHPVRPRVLIVDDQPQNIEVLAEALDPFCDVFAATTGKRAIELARAGVDLILLDVIMPDGDGFEICRRLKAEAKTRSIPVIFVTALGDVEDEARGFAIGGVDYILKPISPPLVRARVRTHLELTGAQRRLEKEAEVLAENLRLKEHVERMSRHDLKTPLASVISLPQILLEDPAFTLEQRRMLRAVEAAGYRILEMVKGSLDLFRMESGTYEFHPTPVDLADLVRRVALDLGGLAREKEVEFDLPAPEPAVLAFAEELLSYSMLANLIKNAVEASPRGGKVQVEIEARDGAVAVRVSNPGAVPAVLRENFFEKYRSSGKKSGTGLGTYSARLMAETQGGRIEMTTSEESGTTVSVTLDRAPESREGAPVGGSGAERRVLIVDDDESTRLILQRFLGPGAIVSSAENGEVALKRAGSFLPEIVLLDAEMPVLDGFDAARRFRALESPNRRPFFLVGLSAHDDAESREQFLEAGCDLVLTKPVTRSGLRAVLEAASKAGDPERTALGDGPRPRVTVDDDLIPLLPAFLESRRQQARQLAQALGHRQDDRESARTMAHKLRGGLEMCGFHEAGAMARSIEEALSGAVPTHEIQARAVKLADYLDRVEYEAPRPAPRRSRRTP